MTDLRKAAEMALEALLNYPLTEGRAIQALRQALAQPETRRASDVIAEKQGSVMRDRSSDITGLLAQPEQEKESTVCAVDSRLLLGRSNNFTKETENRLCDIERRLAAIETQPALAQPEQERLSLRLDVGGGIARASAACGDQIQSVAQELPKREWVGLTVDEILDCYEEHLDRTMFLHRVKSIEAKIKEKNT